MWIFQILLFLSVATAGIFAFNSLGVMSSAQPFITEFGGVMGIFPAWVWIFISITFLAIVIGVANSYLNK